VRQDALKSEQVLYYLVLLILGGCTASPWVSREQGPKPNSLYADRVIWAVVPLRNESGSATANGSLLADSLANSLQTVENMDVLPVNRVIAAMQALELPSLRSPVDVMHLARTLGVDGIVVGTITAYDPYDPPKVGLQLELYQTSQRLQSQAVDIRELMSAPTGNTTPAPGTPGQVPGDIAPVSTASAMLDASNPIVRQRLRVYASGRGGHKPSKSPWWKRIAVSSGVAEKDDTDWHLYRINMNLFTEYVSAELAERLLQAESRRLGLSRRTPGR
tara:strand:+ start:166 stop:990 length:825 start_codon:yes stop_codon:yes gene_type:complete